MAPGNSAGKTVYVFIIQRLPRDTDFKDFAAVRECGEDVPVCCCAETLQWKTLTYRKAQALEIATFVRECGTFTRVQVLVHKNQATFIRRVLHFVEALVDALPRKMRVQLLVLATCKELTERLLVIQRHRLAHYNLHELDRVTIVTRGLPNE